MAASTVAGVCLLGDSAILAATAFPKRLPKILLRFPPLAVIHEYLQETSLKPRHLLLFLVGGNYERGQLWLILKS